MYRMGGGCLIFERKNGTIIYLSVMVSNKTSESALI
jgi:hypothetical protein